MVLISESRRLGEVIRIPESSNNLLKAISLILSRWSGLQMAVRNQWGGKDSLSKSHQLAIDILFWFTHDHSKSTLHLEDLEHFLHERMVLSFNTDLEDGSIEEVAEQLMIMHEEYSHGGHV